MGVWECGSVGVWEVKSFYAHTPIPHLGTFAM